ncbi:cilia- and flagella-associated protein 68 isoform X3 [Arvicanthis niloticus]|uniref:cilia- and flagella-associated protein 68 isoform X3 n=1 Tax=Arvicanthis niloticus TaxID=61156 RepID=UPI00402B4432
MVICIPLSGELERSGMETSLINMEPPYKNHRYSLKISSKSLYSPSSYTSIIQRQNLVCYLRNPHYGSLIYADGHGEMWTDWNDMSKFFQYGWRCTTNENSYSDRTLVGNWNQERYDLKNIVKPKPLPSQDLNESLIGFLDTSLSWILLNTNAQKSQLI